MHAEGGPIYTLVALLMWEGIRFPNSSHDTDTKACPSCSSSPVFLTPYQDGPLDLDSPALFYHRREAAIRERLAFLATASDEALVAYLGDVYRRHYGQAARGVQWLSYPLQLLQLLALGIGGPGCALLCDALSFDHKHLNGGMPDLLLWRVLVPADKEKAEGGVGAGAGIGSGGKMEEELPAVGSAESISVVAVAAASSSTITPQQLVEDALMKWIFPDIQLPRRTKATGTAANAALVQVRLVEVKGPRDSLSEKQDHWIRILLASGIPTAVCKINEPPTGKAAAKAKAAPAKSTTAKKKPAATQKQRASTSGSKDSGVKATGDATAASVSGSKRKRA